MASSDGFQVVRGRKRHHRKNQRKVVCASNRTDVANSLSDTEKASLMKRIEEAK